MGQAAKMLGYLSSRKRAADPPSTASVSHQVRDRLLRWSGLDYCEVYGAARCTARCPESLRSQLVGDGTQDARTSWHLHIVFYGQRAVRRSGRNVGQPDHSADRIIANETKARP